MEAPVPVLTLGELLDRAHSDLAALKASFGGGFLVTIGGRLEMPEGPRKTMTVAAVGGVAGVQIPSPTTVVHPIRSTGRGPFPSMVSVGRTRNNDIVLPDVSVSRFHAFFAGPQAEAGQYLLLDANSRNGTFVDSVGVPNKDSGKPPFELLSGCRVRFGKVDLMFLTAVKLIELGRRL